jgi:hypothetical protein
VGCEKTTGSLIANALPAEKEAANLVSLAITFNDDDITGYASKADLKPKELGFDFLYSVRRAILVAALRTLENK